MLGGPYGSRGIGKCSAGLTEIVTQHRQPHYQVFPLLSDPLTGKYIHTVQRVNPDISFGVPARVLRAIYQCFQFGKKSHPAAVLQKIQSPGWAHALQYQFTPFFEEAFTREPFQPEPLTKLQRLRRDGKSKPRQKLHPPQNTQRVSSELIRAMSQQPRTQVTQSTKRVYQLTRQ